MCASNDFTGHKELVCTVGDLRPGDRYRTPDGGERLLVSPPAADVTRVVDLVTGELLNADPATKLGRDRVGRLYASRSLNPVVPQVAVQQ
jgi:hypothetical protein